MILLYCIPTHLHRHHIGPRRTKYAQARRGLSLDGPDLSGVPTLSRKPCLPSAHENTTSPVLFDLNCSK